MIRTSGFPGSARPKATTPRTSTDPRVARGTSESGIGLPVENESARRSFPVDRLPEGARIEKQGQVKRQARHMPLVHFLGPNAKRSCTQAMQPGLYVGRACTSSFRECC